MRSAGLMTAFAKALRMAPPDRAVLVRAWLMLPVAAVALRAIRLSTLLRAAEPACRPYTRVAPERVAALVEAAARYHLLRTTCLTRALVLCRLLRGQGREARLVLGGALLEGRFGAHAWVVCGGRPLTAGGPVDHFAPLLGAPGGVGPPAGAAGGHGTPADAAHLPMARTEKR